METGEENPEVWSLCFRKPFNNKRRVSSKISRRERERKNIGKKRGRELEAICFWYFACFAGGTAH